MSDSVTIIYFVRISSDLKRKIAVNLLFTAI
ncbi:hypothetical protein BACOV975_02492 [Bacteroides ovatus V975]|nr:hypothetical protein BACOV975_02492 [Bacteroides ovatus V975]